VDGTGGEQTSGAGGKADGRGFRVHARRAMRAVALVTSGREGWEREAAVKNLSLGGACFELNESMMPGEPLTIAFVSPTLWDPLEIEATVAWIGDSDGLESRIGVAFMLRTESAALALLQLISDLDYEADP
jgi:hypothetical protein